jgi:hypothetical protein
LFGFVPVRGRAGKLHVGSWVVFVKTGQMHWLLRCATAVYIPVQHMHAGDGLFLPSTTGTNTTNGLTVKMGIQL